MTTRIRMVEGERRGGASTDRRATNMWARRLIISSSLAVASLAMVPNVAGAATDPNCPTVTQQSIPSMTQPGQPGQTSTTPTTTPGQDCTTTTTSPSTPPKIADSSVVIPPAPAAVSATADGPSDGVTQSLPFTGADVGELAVVGVGAVLAGGLLIRRRRRNAA
jgi:LPXTG-motif cell wall-anchored protein